MQHKSQKIYIKMYWNIVNSRRWEDSLDDQALLCQETDLKLLVSLQKLLEVLISQCTYILYHHSCISMRSEPIIGCCKLTTILVCKNLSSNLHGVFVSGIIFHSRTVNQYSQIIKTVKTNIYVDIFKSRKIHSRYTNYKLFVSTDLKNSISQDLSLCGLPDPQKRFHCQW